MKQPIEDLSRLLDGDLEADRSREAVASFDKVDGEAAREAWTRYALIGDALRGNPTPDDGFTLRILARLRSERERG